jgi:hypothetical protein
MRGDFSRAASHLRAALVSSQEVGDRYATLSIIAFLAWVAADTGRSDVAIRLAGAAAAAHQELLQHHVELFFTLLEKRIFHRVRNELGVETFERIFQDGSLLALDVAATEAVALADEIVAEEAPEL